ncbi:hypothetical protein [Allosphingosinicella vermicomposti]|uniref:hypothetical protein n=1 Tax=Allosphingosinicella vermicomposti TaxID=614671 RepID=UPI000D0FF855|nr:hypothetical protein [Allosphingosinicella vermicomposti]
MGKFTVLAALLLSSAAAAQQPTASAAPEKQYLKEFKAAQGYTFACFGEESAEGCLAMIQHYYNAMMAPDADEGVKHYIFKDYLHAKSVHGGNLREKGKLEEAKAVLQPAYAEMIHHFEGGKHFHALIDNLPLQEETYLTLRALRQDQEAEQVLANARQAADQLHSQLEQSKGNEHQMKLQHAGMLSSEKFETAAAKYHKDRAETFKSEGKSDLAKAERDRAIEGWRRASAWIERSALAGVKGMMDMRPEIRIAEAQMDLGSALLDNGDKKAAEESFIYAGTFSCDLAANTAETPFDRDLAQGLCDRASMGYLLTSGELARISEAQSKAMYEQQMELLKTDITPIMKAMQD